MSKLLHELIKESERLRDIIAYSEKVITKAPKGNVRVSICKNSKQFYYQEKSSDDASVKSNTSKSHNGRYMKKEERELAVRVIEREYYEKLLLICIKRKKEIDKVIEMLKLTEPIKVYETMPKAKRECFTPMVLSDEMYREKWERVIYEGKEFPEDYPEIYSDRGERVRSKTEKIIADKLYKEGIPYRYEEPYKLDKYGIVYPDFKILDVNNRQEIILEHFGMMDDEDYTSKALKKIKMYERQGLVLGKNLMITYETSTEPFDSRLFERMLREYGVM